MLLMKDAVNWRVNLLLTPSCVRSTSSCVRSTTILSDPLLVLSDPLLVLSDPLLVLSDPLLILSDPLLVLSDPLLVRSGCDGRRDVWLLCLAIWQFVYDSRSTTVNISLVKFPTKMTIVFNKNWQHWHKHF